MNGMKKLSNFIQSTAGRNAVPSHAIKTLSDRSKALQDLYTGGFYEFDIEQSSVKHKRPVIWADAEQLLEAVLTGSQIIGNYTVKVMADGGQGFFKISMSINPENYSLKHDYILVMDIEDDDAEDYWVGKEEKTVCSRWDYSKERKIDQHYKTSAGLHSARNERDI